MTKRVDTNLSLSVAIGRWNNSHCAGNNVQTSTNQLSLNEVLRSGASRVVEYHDWDLHRSCRVSGQCVSKGWSELPLLIEEEKRKADVVEAKRKTKGTRKSKEIEEMSVEKRVKMHMKE
ncbi:hypothetical protein K435DRAFT_791484 [Dendrothele bispora CBS 962.96]|uniref:Uncharacterized protein n=1 Tax=Dendrothele bispora (strain CBS 962.96) TaxID=1314807 RepID=A0A4S8MLJ6_DENBC|nr:hypothetical protein K435DRAFT_791484 [Dendrothele bispora CBS 962.96]